MAVIFFDSLGSTNSEARGYPDGSVIVAAEQTDGRGRFGRSWSSGRGGLYMSMVLKAGARDSRFLTLLAAVAVRRALQAACGVDARIKWPNDLILEGKKVCGILTESVIEGDEAKMVIGIGINTGNEIPPGLTESAISLSGLGISADNKALAERIIGEIGRLRGLGRGEVLDEWRRFSHTIGRMVRVETLNGAFTGRAAGIDNDGNLLVDTDGGRRIVVEGDILPA